MKSPWLKRLLIGAGVLVLLIAAALAYVIATFDPNAYKGVAIDWMKTHRGRTLAISGPIKLSVFPRLAVQVSGVSLSEKKSNAEFVALDEASLAVALLPLLRQQVVVDRVSARGLRLHYMRNDKGVANFDDLLQPAPSPPGASPAAADGKSGQPLRFDVSGIQLEQVTLTLRDDQAKLAGVVTLNSLRTGRLADQAESPVKLDAALAFSAPAMQGQLNGETQLALDLAAQLVKLRDMKLTWKGTLPGVQAAEATLKGALTYDGQRGTLQANAVELKGGATLGTLRLAGSSLTMQHFAFDPANRTIALDKLQVKLAGTQGGSPLSVSLDWPQFSVKGESLTGSALSGELHLQGPISIEASFKTAAPSGRFDHIRVPGFTSTLRGRNGPREIAGTIGTDLLVQPGAGSLAFDELDAKLAVKEPSLQALGLSIKGKADVSAQAAHWNLNGQINANPFSAEGSAVLATTPPTIKLNARFDALDLNRLLPAAAAAASAPAVAPAAPDTPVDLSPLRALQGQFDLHIGKFAYQVYRIEDADLEATLEGGMLRVTRLAGRAWNGTLNATAFADARASRVAVNATAADVNVDALLKDVAKKDLLEGTGRVVLDVESAGRSVNELKSRLQGKASLQLREGAVKGVNLAKKFREAKATLGLKQKEERQRASQTEKTDFSELSASFAISDGVARNNDLDLKSPFLRLGGDGLLDIGKGRIDYTARATVAATAKGQDGADLAALKGLTVPVHLTGPFESIDWSIQWGAMAGAALKSELGSRMEDKLRDKLGLPAAANGASSAGTSKSIENAARDKLKDKLKGLFK